MSELLKDIDHGKLVNEDPVLCEAGIEALRFYRAENRLDIELHVPELLSRNSYEYLSDRISDLTGSSVNILIHADRADCSLAMLSAYLDYFFARHGTMLAGKVFTYDSEKRKIDFLCISQNEADISSLVWLLQELVLPE